MQKIHCNKCDVVITDIIQAAYRTQIMVDKVSIEVIVKQEGGSHICSGCVKEVVAAQDYQQMDISDGR